MRILNSLKRRLVCDVGASEIAEAALVLPLLFMILLGIYWFGRAFNIYATINHAAQEVARIGVAQSCANCGNHNIDPTVATTLIDGILQASSVDPNQIIQRPIVPSDCDSPPFPPHQVSQLGSNNNILYYNYIRLTPAGYTPSICGVRITFQYPYQFWLPFTSLNNQRIVLTADVQMKGEY